MNLVVKIMLAGIIFICTSFMAISQTSEYEATKQEIIETFGSFPSFFDAFPKHALAGAWKSFKTLKGPESPIDPKHSELIQLAVSAQIPCQYCIYFHTAVAEANGATKDEIQAAIALGAETRHWSMILQGNQINFEEFKKEFDKMMEYMAAKSKQ